MEINILYAKPKYRDGKDDENYNRIQADGVGMGKVFVVMG